MTRVKAEDMSNISLGRFLSFEFLGLLVVGGMAWGSLQTEVSAQGGTIQEHSEKHSADISDIRGEQKSLAKDVTEIKNSVVEMQANQRHFKEKMDAQGETQKEILQILRSQYPNGNGH